MRAIANDDPNVCQFAKLSVMWTSGCAKTAERFDVQFRVTHRKGEGRGFDVVFAKLLWPACSEKEMSGIAERVRLHWVWLLYTMLT